MLKKKVEIAEFSDDTTDIFQYNLLDCYLNRLIKTFKLGQYQIIDQLCSAELLLICYTDPRSSESTENNCCNKLMT